MSQFEQVREFHRAFGVACPDKPTLLEDQAQWLRISLIKEELQEYMDAVANDDLVEAADALCDLAYVVFGAADCHGFTRFDEMFDEVQRSNMSKLGADGKPMLREDGKVLKGPGFFKPNLAQFLTPSTEASTLPNKLNAAFHRHNKKHSGEVVEASIGELFVEFMKVYEEHKSTAK